MIRHSKSKLEQIIKKQCKKTMDCEFKCDWIPRGYFVAKIDRFTKELTNEIKQLVEDASRY